MQNLKRYCVHKKSFGCEIYQANLIFNEPLAEGAVTKENSKTFNAVFKY